MPSWRQTTPQAVQDDLDGVLSAALDTAQHLLAKNGDFFPFGITVSDIGDIGMAAGDPGLGEKPDSMAVLDTLYAGATTHRHEYRAVGS